MEFIELKESDIKNALDLVWTVFQEFEAPEYSNAGIDEFRKFIKYDSIVESLNKGELHFYGCKVSNELTGVIATRGFNHICLLFIDKNYHRQGLAKQLFHIIIEKCKSQSNNNKITVNSSPYAVEVYHHLGFTDTDFEQTVNGIRFTPMEYLIKQ